MNVDIKILDARLRENMPAYATPGSAGLDLRACIDAPLTLQPMDRLAQLIIVPVVQPRFTVVEEFESASERGAGGYGSTGKQ
jgi:dUTPase